MAPIVSRDRPGGTRRSAHSLPRPSGESGLVYIMHIMGENQDESKQMRELVSRCPRGPRSGADVGREVLAGEGGAGCHEVRRGALENDPATVVAGAGAEVDSSRRAP